MKHHKNNSPKKTTNRIGQLPSDTVKSKTVSSTSLSLVRQNQIVVAPIQKLALTDDKSKSIVNWLPFQISWLPNLTNVSSKSMAILALILAFSSLLGLSFLGNYNIQNYKNANAQSANASVPEGQTLPEGTILSDGQENWKVVYERQAANQTGIVGPGGSGSGVATGTNISPRLERMNGQANNKYYPVPKADWNTVFQSMIKMDLCMGIGGGQTVSIGCYKVNGQRITDRSLCPAGWTPTMSNGPFADLPGLRYRCDIEERDYPQMVSTKNNPNAGNTIQDAFGQYQQSGLTRQVLDPNGRNLLRSVNNTVLSTTALTESYKQCLRSSGVDPDKTLQANVNTAGFGDRNGVIVIKNSDLDKVKNGDGYLEYGKADFEMFPNISCSWPAGYTAIPVPRGNEIEAINNQYFSVNNPNGVEDKNYQTFEANGAVIKESEFVACKKDKRTLSGAGQPVESVICYFPNANVKRNQIRGDSKTLWCPRGWQNYNGSAQTDLMACSLSKLVDINGNPNGNNSKYQEYVAKIDNGQIRQELPSASTNNDPVSPKGNVTNNGASKTVDFEQPQPIPSGPIRFKKAELKVNDEAKRATESTLADDHYIKNDQVQLGSWKIWVSGLSNPAFTTCSYERTFDNNVTLFGADRAGNYGIYKDGKVLGQTPLTPEEQQKVKANRIMTTTCWTPNGQNNATPELCKSVSGELLSVSSNNTCRFKGDIFGVKYLLPQANQDHLTQNYVYEKDGTISSKDNSSVFKAINGITAPNSPNNSTINQVNQNSQNNDKVCATVITVGQSVTNRQDIKQFPSSCLDDGYEKITAETAATTAFRMSECSNDNGNFICKKIDGRQVTKSLDCPKGWTSEIKTAWKIWGINTLAQTRDSNSESSASGCILKRNLWGEGLSRLIKLENGLLKDADSASGNNNSQGGQTQNTNEDMLGKIAKKVGADDTKCQNLSITEKNVCQGLAITDAVEANYQKCEKDGNEKLPECEKDIADLAYEDFAITPVAPKNNPSCNPEPDTDGKTRDLNEQQCSDRKAGYKGPFNFQSGGKRGTRNCYYVGTVLAKPYGCDQFGYLKISCDLIGRYAGSDPNKDVGNPDCKSVGVPTTPEANAAIRSTKVVYETKVDDVKVLASDDIPMMPTLPNMPTIGAVIFEPTETKNGLEKNQVYVMNPEQKTAWKLGQVNVFAADPATKLPGAAKGSISGKQETAKQAQLTTPSNAPATGTGVGFNIQGLNLLNIDCLFARGEDAGSSAASKTEGCLVDRLTDFLIALSYPLALLVLIWAGYQYFIGGVDGKSNGLKAVQAVIIGIALISGSKLIIDTITQTVSKDPNDAFNTAPIIALIKLVKDFLVALSSFVAVLVIVWGGYKFFFSGLDWEKEGGIKAIKNAVIGLGVILIANSMVDTLANIGNEIALNPATGVTTALDKLIKPALADVTYLLFALASVVAVLVIVWGGYKYFFSGLEISKKDGLDNIRSGVIGLVTIILAQQIVNIVEAAITPAAPGGSSILNINTDSITGFIVSIVNGVLVPISTACAVFFVIMGGFYWTTSNGDDKRIQKAKKSLVNALIGLVIVILAVSIVQLVRFLTGSFTVA